MIVRDSSNTKSYGESRSKNFFLFLLVGKRIAKTRSRTTVSCVGKRVCDCVSRSRYSSFFRARVSLVLCVSLSLCVSVSRSRGKCPASDGLKRTERGESHGSERERAPAAFERVVPRYPCLLSLNLFFPIRICLSSFVRFSVRLECAGRVEVSTTAKHRSKLRIYLKTLRGSLR